MTATAPAERMADMLLAYEKRLLNLEKNTDGNMLAALLDADKQVLWHLPEMQPYRNDWLRSALKLQAVAPAAFMPVAHRLALLEAPELLRVLAARAVFARRQALRRCIDRSLIEPLRLLLGAATLQVLRNSTDNHNEEHAPTPLQKTSGAVLAHQGYACFLQDGVWHNDTLATLIRVALPALDMTSVPAIENAADNAVSHNESTLFLTLLPALFPELTCLFG